MSGGQSPPAPDPSGRRYLPPSGGTDLVPGIVQDAESGRVLMLGYLNQDAIDLTVETGFVHFWSRSRQQMWKKGETSGNTLRFVDMVGDCDSDALLIRANPDGPTCHTGEVSCFAGRESLVAGREYTPYPRPSGSAVLSPLQGDYPPFSLESLWRTIQERKRVRPEGSYTVQLLDGGVDLVGRKVLEEAGEVLMAAKDHANGVADSRRVAEEAGDVIYHLLALLAERDITLDEVFNVLQERSQ